MTTLIIANGLFEGDTSWIKPRLQSADVVLAADGGANHLHLFNHPPQHLIGDGDSLKPEVKEWLIAHHTQFHLAPCDKDETDLELALHFAVTQGGARERIEIIGVFGGRLDQMIANILLLAHPRWIDHPIYLCDREQTAWLVRGTTTIFGRTGDIVSLIPLGGAATIRATRHLRWPLHDSILQFGPARGVSNKMTADWAEVKVAEGVVLCVHQSQNL